MVDAAGPVFWSNRCCRPLIIKRLLKPEQLFSFAFLHKQDSVQSKYKVITGGLKFKSGMGFTSSSKAYGGLKVSAFRCQLNKDWVLGTEDWVNQLKKKLLNLCVLAPLRETIFYLSYIGSEYQLPVGLLHFF